MWWYNDNDRKSICICANSLLVFKSEILLELDGLFLFSCFLSFYGIILVKLHIGYLHRRCIFHTSELTFFHSNQIQLILKVHLIRRDFANFLFFSLFDVPLWYFFDGGDLDVDDGDSLLVIVD